MMITTENIVAHVTSRYCGKRGKIIGDNPGVNLFGEELFRTFTFENGSYVTFALCIDGTWFRHNGGGRYGPRKNYEG
jgi:hypothetical protein